VFRSLAYVAALHHLEHLGIRRGWDRVITAFPSREYQLNKETRAGAIMARGGACRGLIALSAAAVVALVLPQAQRCNAAEGKAGGKGSLDRFK
jgi:hypothetical protein